MRKMKNLVRSNTLTSWETNQSDMWSTRLCAFVVSLYWLWWHLEILSHARAHLQNVTRFEARSRVRHSLSLQYLSSSMLECHSRPGVPMCPCFAAGSPPRVRFGYASSWAPSTQPTSHIRLRAPKTARWPITICQALAFCPSYWQQLHFLTYSL